MLGLVYLFYPMSPFQQLHLLICDLLFFITSGSYSFKSLMLMMIIVIIIIIIIIIIIMIIKIPSKEL